MSRPSSKLTEALKNSSPPREDDEAKEAPETPEPEDDKELSFTAEDLESDDTDDSPSPGETPAQAEARKSRSDKKRERGREHAQKLEQEREARIRAEERERMLREDLARRQAPDPKEETNKALDALAKKRADAFSALKSHSKTMTAQMTDEDMANWEKELDRRREEYEEISDEYRDAKKGRVSREQLQQELAKARFESKSEALKEEFDDVFSDPSTKPVVEGIFARMLAATDLDMARDFDSPRMWKLRREALSEARRASKPNDVTKNKYVGSSSASARGNGKVEWTPSTEEKKLANSLYGHIPDKKTRLLKFYREVKSKK